MEKKETNKKLKHRQQNKNPDVSYIKEIVKILKDNELAEIKYEADGIEIKIVAQSASLIEPNRPNISGIPSFGNVSQSVIVPQLNSPSQPIVQPTLVPQIINNTGSQDKRTEIDYSNSPGAIKSPMVGTCYLSPEPGATKFVNEGDIVKKDQPLLIIEAMKVMNYIKAPRDGKIIHIAVDDAQPIEFGQLLLVIE